MVSTISVWEAVSGRVARSIGRRTTGHKAIAVNRMYWNIWVAAATMSTAGVVSAARPVGVRVICGKEKAHGKANCRGQDDAHVRFLAKM